MGHPGQQQQQQIAGPVPIEIEKHQINLLKSDVFQLQILPQINNVYLS